MRCEFALHYPVADDSKNYATALIHLFPSRNGFVKEGTDTRTELQMPEYEPERWHQYYGKLRKVDIPEAGVWVSHGADSQETRKYGNLFGISRPLRHAMYYEAGIRRPVLERYPEWDEVTGNVTWVTEEVVPERSDDRFRALLTDKVAALRWLQEADPCMEDGAFGFRDFARHVIVAECVAAIDPEQSRRTLLSLVRELRRENLANGGESNENHSRLRIIDTFGPPTNRTLVSFKCTTETCRETLYQSEQFNMSKYCDICSQVWAQPQTAMQTTLEESEALSKTCAGDNCEVRLDFTLKWIRRCARLKMKLGNFCHSCKLAYDTERKAALAKPGLWEWWKHNQRPGQANICTTFVDFGRCDWYPDCKHHHPAPPSMPLAPHASFLTGSVGNRRSMETETNAIVQYRGESSSHSHGRVGGGSTHHPARAPTALEYPQRPKRTVCDLYIRTGSCELGTRCPLHHPVGGVHG
jgi:hypothetical protein